MNSETNIIGCFVHISLGNWDDDQKAKDAAKEQGDLFRTYIWGENGICSTMKKLNYSDYGKDLIRILFQYYVNPMSEELEQLKEIERYRKKEKSIGIPIIVNGDNFFNKSEVERHLFLKYTINEKLCLLEETIKKKKLDTDFRKLKADLESILS